MSTATRHDLYAALRLLSHGLTPEPELPDRYAARRTPRSSPGQSSLFVEEDHPRDSDGQFVEKGSGTSGSSKPAATLADEPFTLANQGSKLKSMVFESLGGRQQALFDTRGKAGQMGLFAEAGQPEELTNPVFREQQAKPQQPAAANGRNVKAAGALIKAAWDESKKMGMAAKLPDKAQIMAHLGESVTADEAHEIMQQVGIDSVTSRAKADEYAKKNGGAIKSSTLPILVRSILYDQDRKSRLAESVKQAGDAKALEYRDPAGEHGAWVHPAAHAEHQGEWQVTRFHNDEPLGHEYFKSRDEAIGSAVGAHPKGSYYDNGKSDWRLVARHAHDIFSAYVERYAARHPERYAQPHSSAGQRSLLGPGGRGERRPEKQRGLHWVTIGGQAEGDKSHVGGTPIQIDGDGNIHKGAEWATSKGATNVKHLGGEGRQQTNQPAEQPANPAAPVRDLDAEHQKKLAAVPVVSNDDIGEPWDTMHAGLASELVQRKIAVGMEGIDGREYGIREHSPGKWQLVSRPKGQAVGQPQPDANQQLLQQSTPYRQNGEQYDRNIAEAANDLELALSSENRKKFVPHLAEALKMRLANAKPSDARTPQQSRAEAAAKQRPPEQPARKEPWAAIQSRLADMPNATTDDLQAAVLRSPDKRQRVLAEKLLRSRGESIPQRPAVPKGLQQRKPAGKDIEDPQRSAMSGKQMESAKAALLKAGAKLEHESESGSLYFRLPDGRTIRVADHSLPSTGERDARGSAWDHEIVLSGRGDEANATRAVESVLDSSENDSAPVPAPQPTEGDRVVDSPEDRPAIQRWVGAELKMRQGELRKDKATPSKLESLDGQALKHMAQDMGVLPTVYADVNEGKDFREAAIARIQEQEATEAKQKQEGIARANTATNRQKAAQQEWAADLPKYTDRDVLHEYQQAKAARDYRVPLLEAEMKRRGLSAAPKPAPAKAAPKPAPSPAPAPSPKSQAATLAEEVASSGKPLYAILKKHGIRPNPKLMAQVAAEVDRLREAKPAAKLRDEMVAALSRGRQKATSVSPQAKLDEAITAAVGSDPQDREQFARFAADSHKRLTEQVTATNDSFRQLLGQFGYSGARAAGMIRAARNAADLDSFQRAGYPLDKMAQMIDSDPHTYAGMTKFIQGESTGRQDTEQALFQRLKEGGLVQPPARHDPRVVEDALAQWNLYAGEEDDEARREREAMQEEAGDTGHGSAVRPPSRHGRHQQDSGDVSFNPDEFDVFTARRSPGVRHELYAALRMQAAGLPVVERFTLPADRHEAYAIQQLARFGLLVDYYAAKRKSQAGQRSLFGDEPTDTGKEHWITIGGGEGRGTHVLVDEDKRIVRGPAALKGKELGDLSKPASEPKADAPRPNELPPPEQSAKMPEQPRTNAKPSETPYEPEQRPAASGPASGRDSGRDAGHQPGGNDGGSDRGTDREGGRRPRIVTARGEHTPAVDTAVVSEGLRKHLNEAQVTGVAACVNGMDKHGGFVLADGTGVGKTRQILGVAKTYADQGRKVIIVAPAGVIKQDWKKGTVSGSYRDDSAAMGIDIALNRGDKEIAPGSVHITTYESLGDIKSQVDSNTIVIYDECQALKNWASTRAKHGKDMSHSARSVLYASATPADKPLQIGYLFRARIFGNRTFSDVYSELGMHQVTQRTYGGGTVQKWDINPRVGLPEVYRRMSGLFDRMTKDGLMIKREVSLDGLSVEVQNVELSEEAHEELRQIAAKYNEPKDRAVMLMSQRMAQERHKIPAALTSIKQELAAGRQVVLFGASVNATGDEDDEGGGEDMNEGTMIRLREALTEAGIPFAELHGAATKAQQRKGMEDFQSGKVKVIIGTVQSGGTGVNLDDRKGNAPRTVLMMTPPFAGMENVQAAGRVQRMTTRSDSKIKYLMAGTTVDEWNAKIIRSKMATLGATVGGDVGKLDIPAEYEDLDKRAMGEKLIAQKGAYEWKPLVRGTREDAPKPNPIQSISDDVLKRAGDYANDATVTQEGRDRVKRLIENARSGNAIATVELHDQFSKVGDKPGNPIDAPKSPAASQAPTEVPKPPQQKPTAAAPVPAPAERSSEGKSPAPSISTRVINTQRGQRHVHGFSPSQRFWTAWRKWKDAGGKPEYLSVSKNPRTGDWEASIWGDTPQQVAGYRDDLMRRLERFAVRHQEHGRELYSVLSAMVLDRHERYAYERIKAILAV